MFVYIKKGDNLYISDFPLYSICILMLKLKENEVLHGFLDDISDSENILLIKAGPEEISDIIKVSEKYKLDFDDAYQYYLADKMGLIIVSYDSDFDRTDKGKKKPEEIK